MKSGNLARYSLLAGLLAFSCSSICGAQNVTNAASAPASGQAQEAAAPVDVNATNTTVSSDSPQIQAANQRVDTAKTNLDTAHKRLNAAKAFLKAAEAEFKAAKADREALALSEQAQQLADASGMPKTTDMTAQPAATSFAQTGNANALSTGGNAGTAGSLNNANSMNNANGAAENTIDFSATSAATAPNAYGSSAPVYSSVPEPGSNR